MGNGKIRKSGRGERTAARAKTRSRIGPRAASRARIEARILAAAEKIFAATGFEGATTGAIAKAAGLPKANLHYYFKTKAELYARLLADILAMWLATADRIDANGDPAEALAHYIREKIALARRRPLASRVFANEIIHGAPRLKGFLARDLKAWVETKARFIRAWIAAGRMRAIDPAHLFFAIWAATQTYADFAAQIAAILGRSRLNAADYRLAADQLTTIFLTGLGLDSGVQPVRKGKRRHNTG